MKFHILYKNIIVAFLLTICVYYTEAQVVTPFSIRYQTTQKGGIVYLANVAVACSSNPPALGGSCGTASNQVPPSGSGVNNSFNQVYVDIDSDASTFQSSSDSLNLPNCSNITWAGLYWGAMGTAATAPTRNNIKIKVNNGAYQNISSDVSQLNTTGYSSYHNFKDITSIVQAAGTKARFTVANIPFVNSGSNRWGSWQIVVVYGNQLQNMRQLTVFDGLANVSGSSVVNVPISGFLTPPTGPVSFELGTYVHDGDRSYTGDQMLFSGNGGPFINITDGLNPTSDVFNSTVSNKGVLTPFRVPNLNNTMGLDADIFEPNNAAKNFLGNSNTSATLRLTTGGETYLVQEISTVIDVYEPDVRIDKKVTDRFGNNMYLSTVAPGDTLTYRITVYNIGSDSSLNTFVTDSIPKESTFVPGSINYVFGPNSGSKTDAAADDQGEYNGTNGKLTFRVGTGANGSSGGKVGNSPTGVDSTVITYKVTASDDCMVLKCNNLIANRGFVTSTGKISGNTITNGSNPAAFDGFGCPISGSTDTYINVSLASCTFPPDTTIANLCPATESLASLYTRSGYTTFLNSSFTPVITAATTGTYYAIRTGATGCKDTVAITVSATVCTPPNVGKDCGVTSVNTPQTGNMGTNNYFPLGYSSTYFNTIPVKNPNNGMFSINNAGAYTYTPNMNYTGVDTVVVSYCGVPTIPGPDLCFNDTLFITVIGDAVVNKDSATTTQDAFVTGNILTNNSHPNGGVYTATPSPLVKNPSNGVIDVLANGSYTYTPNPGFTGRDTVVVNVCVKVAVASCTTDTVTICKNDTLILIVNAGAVSGGDDAGVESKSLGNIIAQRLYGNAINSVVAKTYDFIKPTNLVLNAPTDLRLVDLAPATVLYSNKSIITTPTDLVNFTNAVDVLAVDYKANTNTNAVFFGTKTFGDAYNHTKQICDRLKNAELLDVNILSVNDYSVVAYKIKQRNGQIEYATNLNLGVNINNPTISLQSSWFTSSIIPSEQLYNIQLWAASEPLLQNLVNSVISNASKFGAISVINQTALVPELYITKGKRNGAELVLFVKNNSTISTGYFELKEKQSETSAETTRQIPFSVAANTSHVKINVADFYEASIYMHANNKLVDLVYMADGSWNLDYNKNNTNISHFKVNNETNPTVNIDELRLFRNATVAATTKDYVSLYKTINGGGLEENLSQYKSLKFNAATTGFGNVKVTIIKKSFNQWNNQFSYTTNFNETGEYAINLSDFKDANGNSGLKADDIVSVNLAFQNTRGGSINATATVSNLRFSKQNVLQTMGITKSIAVYPNPTTEKFTTSFVSDVDENVVIRVVEASSGRIIKTVFTNAKKGQNIVNINLGKAVINGIYTLTIISDNGKYQTQRVLINK